MPTNRKHRKRAYKRTGDRCYYCGVHKTQARMTLDHLLPRSRGGTRTAENTVPACYTCNQAKGDMTAEEYLASLGVAA